MLRQTRFAIAAFCVAFVTAAYSQEVMEAATPASSPRIEKYGSDKVVEALGNMNLRESPPEGTAAWFSKGSQIGTVKKGEVLMVQDKRELPSLTGSQTWLKVQRVDAPPGAPNEGWLYVGKEGYVVPATIKPQKK